MNFKDIPSVGKPRLTKLVIENLLNGLVFLASFSVSNDNDNSGLSVVASLYIVSFILQTFMEGVVKLECGSS